MSDKLQQAIASIKSGNNQIGQQILVQVLKEEPNNESAWLWMSAVVSEDKRQYCIKRVLMINPNNQKALLAMQALNNSQTGQKNNKPQESLQNPTEAYRQSLSESTNRPAPINGQSPKSVYTHNKAINEPAFLIPKNILGTGMKIGALGAALVLPVHLIAYFSQRVEVMRIGLLINLAVFISTGIATGITLFRRSTISKLSTTLSGGLSGIVSGVICGMAMWYLFILPNIMGRFEIYYLLTCGGILPLITGIAGAVTVWIPRVFPHNFKASTRNHTEVEIFEAKKQTPSLDQSLTLQELPYPANAGQKFWINPDKSKASAIFLLEHELISGKININSLPQVQEGISRGSVQYESLQDKTIILYKEISAALRIGTTVKIESAKDKIIATHNLDCVDEHTAKLIIDGLFEKLGAKFEKSTTLPSLSSAISVPGVVILMSLACLILFYFASASITVRQIYAIGGGYAEIILSSLRFLASGGMAAISGGVALITLGVMIFRAANPSEIIKLSLKEGLTNKLQQAIASINSGENEKGLVLLTQIVKKEPKNETAWLLMSTLVEEGKKLLYLQQVLRINPGNQQALQAVEELRQFKARNPPTSASIEPIIPTSLSQDTISFPQPESSAIQFWINPTRKGTHIFVILEQKLFIAKCEANLTSQVDSRLTQGRIPTELLTEKISIEYNKLIKVTEVGFALWLDFFDKSQHKENARIECKDDQTLQAILNILEKKLGKGFERVAAPMSRRKALAGNSILILIVAAIATFLYFGAVEIESGNVTTTGSIRTRGIINLLDLIGPDGVLFIGGGLLLILFIFMISMLVKPPIINTITRKTSTEINDVPEVILTNVAPEPDQDQYLGISTEKLVNKPSSLGSAALSDGLMVGLTGGIIGILFPTLYILTHDTKYFGIGIFIDIAVLLLTGIATGILFYRRKLPRGSKAVGIGGGVGGAISGTICGLMLGFSMNSYISETGLGSNLENYSSFFLILFCAMPAILGAGIGTLTAWIPGIFIKPDPNLRPFDWKEGKSEVEVARIEASQDKSKKSMKNRLIMAGFYIALLLIVFLCKALVG